MFSNILNKFHKKETTQQEEKSTKQLIEEIHETFYTEVDRLLAEASIAKSLETDKQDLVDKANRLKAIGFGKAKEVQEATEEIRRLEKIYEENRKTKNLLKQLITFLSNIRVISLLRKKALRRFAQNMDSYMEQ